MVKGKGISAQCEACGVDNPTVTFEGFLVCGSCRRARANELSARRRKEDTKTLATLGEALRAKGIKL